MGLRLCLAVVVLHALVFLSLVILLHNLFFQVEFGADKNHGTLGSELTHFLEPIA
jgi:hypothetical protein